MHAASWEPPQRMASPVFTVHGYDLLPEYEELGGNLIEELVGKLNAESARLKRLLPDAPEGFEWVGDIEVSEELMKDEMHYRVIYRLKEIR